MEFHIVFFLTLVSAGSLYEANAYVFSEIGRTEIESPPNDYLELDPGDQKITFKKEITKDNPLLLDAEVTFERGDTGDQVWNQAGLDMCNLKKYDKETWEFVAVNLFLDTIIPGQRNKKCPVKSQTYDTQYSVDAIKSNVSAELDYGVYSMLYTVKSSEGDDVFSKLKYTFKLEEDLQQ